MREAHLFDCLLHCDADRSVAVDSFMIMRLTTLHAHSETIHATRPLGLVLAILALHRVLLHLLRRRHHSVTLRHRWLVLVLLLRRRHLDLSLRRRELLWLLVRLTTVFRVLIHFFSTNTH